MSVAFPEDVEQAMKIPKQGPVIAIDGPAGTGKTSVTHRLCEALGYVHVDTGALYRAVAFVAREQGLSPGPNSPDNDRVTELARTAHLEFKRNAKMNPSNRILVNGDDVSDKIRTPEVSMLASTVSAIPGVRAALLGIQRRLGCAGKSILEGRDIGTVIFPDADVKFYLTATTDERAKRRLAEYEALGKDPPSFEELRKQIFDRDQADMSRAVAPLKRAPDAVEIDTSTLTLDQVVAKMEAEVRTRLKK